jgi:hypothetical protein
MTPRQVDDVLCQSKNVVNGDAHRLRVILKSGVQIAGSCYRLGDAQGTPVHGLLRIEECHKTGIQSGQFWYVSIEEIAAISPVVP